MIRRIVYFLVLTGILNLGFSSNKTKPLATGFAVIELFTSEGCSSCPPADALIARIAHENKGRPVYILAYHVDYWNRLGWKDKFSDARYSARQRQYATWLNLKNVYTPQIVVNGSKEFIGSEEKTLRSALSNALSQKTDVRLEIGTEKQGTALTFNYKTNQKTDDYHLVVATIKASGINKIERGENRGKTLAHVQIVSDFEAFDLKGKASGKINLPAKEKSKDSQIIAFLQNAKTGKIIAAANTKNDERN